MIYTALSAVALLWMGLVEGRHVGRGAVL